MRHLKSEKKQTLGAEKPFEILYVDWSIAGSNLEDHQNLLENKMLHSTTFWK